MRVTATKPGYFGKLRAAGDTFDVPAGSKASWFVPAPEVKKTESDAKADGTKKAGKAADDLT